MSVEMERSKKCVVVLRNLHKIHMLFEVGGQDSWVPSRETWMSNWKYPSMS